LIWLPRQARAGAGAVFAIGELGTGGKHEDARIYVVKGIDFGKPTLKEDGK
jgi:hypothetical protein